MRKILLCLSVLTAMAACSGSVGALYRTVSSDTATETELPVRAFAENNHIFSDMYPESMIALLERNPETEDFVLNYPFHGEEVATLAGTPRDSVPLFLQWDQRWGYANYGSDVLGITGCGPTCLAMVHYYLTGDEHLTPAEMGRFSLENGYYQMGHGSLWSLFTEGAPQLGLCIRQVPLTEKAMMASLTQGCPLVLSVGPGDFTAFGHYIVMSGVEDGKFRVNDPNSRRKSERLWSFDEISSQIRNVWEFTLPT